MNKFNDPCSICENYGADDDFECHLIDNCPVAAMKRRNDMLIREVSSLKRRISRMKSDASWDEEIRRGQVQGMW